jgi:hypothetical protein
MPLFNNERTTIKVEPQVLRLVPNSQPGPRGLPSSGTYYRHIQDTPSTVWVINHDIGRYPVVQAFDTDMPPNEIDGDIEHVTTSQLTITFGVPVAGTANLS